MASSAGLNTFDTSQPDEFPHTEPESEDPDGQGWAEPPDDDIAIGTPEPAQLQPGGTPVPDQLQPGAPPRSQDPTTLADAPAELSSSPKGMGIRKKHRKLDPKSQKDLDERAFIPNALTSKADFTAMFGRYKTKWAHLGKDSHGIEAGKVYDVLTLTEQKMDFVRKEMPHWSDAHVRLGAAAVHLYNRRLSDLSERDNVQILWMCAGEHLVRVHEGGQLFVY